MSAPVRCQAATKAGKPCRARAVEGSTLCFLDTPEVDPAELGCKAGLANGVRRSVREPFREDAERNYETLIASLLAAVSAEVTRWGDCPECRHRVPVTFPDIRARTHAIEVLIDQGYGRPETQTAGRHEHVHATPPWRSSGP